MNSLRFSIIAVGIALLTSTTFALADGEITITGKIEALYNEFSNDYYSCWNDGNAHRCRNNPQLVTSESYARADGVADLTDGLTLVGRVHGALYANNAFYTVSKGEENNPSYDYRLTPFNPVRTHTEFEDTWVGLRHENVGTFRIGRGLNPRQQALEGDGHTDVGGREMLERMIAYDSPILIGEKGNGMSLSSAHYQGTHMRKEIRIYDIQDRQMMDAIRAEGDAILFDSTLGSKFNLKLAYYREQYAARQYYDGGPLDYTGSTFVPNTAAKVRSHGPAVRISYEFANSRFGLSYSDNRRDAVNTGQTSYAKVAYKTQIATLYASAWSGPWSAYGRVTGGRYRVTVDGNWDNSNDWIYANNTRNVLQYGGEISYEFWKGARALIGYDYKRVDFHESPVANGICRFGEIHPCYDPEGYKVYSGIRWML